MTSMGIQRFFAVLVFFVNVGAGYASVIPTADFKGVMRMDHTPNLISNMKVFNDEPQNSDFLCDTCLDVSSESLKILSDTDLSEKFEMVFSELCKILPPDMESKCVDTSKTYVNEIISYLQYLFEEDNLCYGTGLCTKNDEISRASKIISSLSMSLKSSDNKGCTMCLNATDAFLNALDDPEIKIKVIKTLLIACQQVENHIQQCKKLVYEYAPILLSGIVKYLKASDMCTLLQLCPRISDV